ncbi:M56 family metallopeptidase [Pedobacter paludis]|uniref:Peptidase M56 domain-containing protein n=1 Tax=Pedobacter paludis TaxID=2203212 RepID=A0A317EVE3_9SPHI|nr:M56 family metallopeptidase [Pedobacter paludis]PWS29913.1 hypothetical protein DF947_20200 [Pedobacter paludis]
MNGIYYLLEANLYLIIFYGFYRVFLHKETFYALNRYYLIATSTIAFTLPFLQIGYLKREIVVIGYSGFVEIQQKQSWLNIENICMLAYFLVCLIFMSKMVWGLLHLKNLIKSSEKARQNGILLIEIPNSKRAFSFFNCLFIDPEIPQKNTVLKHEMVHIKQKHSLDILLFEIIQITSWFNPIIYFIKNDIKLIHEYLADEETTLQDIPKYDYAVFLIQNSYGNQNFSLTNQIFNSSILKNRISMLNQKKSANWARLRLLFMLPLIGGMLCLSTMAFTKSYGTIEIGAKKEMLSIAVQDTIKKKADKKKLPPPPPIEPRPRTKNLSKSKVDQVRFPPPIVKKDGKKLPPPLVIEDIKRIPPPPPVEPKSNKNNDSEIIYGDPIPNEGTINKNSKTIYGDPSLSSKNKEIKLVTVTGYPNSKSKPKTKVQSLTITPIKSKPEVVIIEEPTKKQ